MRLRNPFGRSLYLEPKRFKVPRYVWALMVLIGVSLLLFVVLPSWIASYQRRLETRNQAAHAQRFETNVYRVVAGTLPIFSEPNSRGMYCSELLYNEAVKLVGKQDAKGFVRIQTSDGCEGYVTASQLSVDLRPIDPAMAVKKLVVLSSGRYLRSDALRGDMMTELPMGAILYADYASQDLFRVRHLGDQYGWISKQQLQVLEPGERPGGAEEATAQLFVSALMNFYKTPYRTGGLSSHGISTEGAIFIAARIYGRELPRLIGPQSNLGEEVKLGQGSTVLDLVRPLLHGDILYLAKDAHSKEIVDCAVVIEKGQVLMHRSNESTLQIEDLTMEDLKRVRVVRRHFPQSRFVLTEPK